MFNPDPMRSVDLPPFVNKRKQVKTSPSWFYPVISHTAAFTLGMTLVELAWGLSR